MKSRAGAAALVAACLVSLTVLAAGASAGRAVVKDTVHIRGTAYSFFDIDDRVPGAVIRVDEFPELSAPVQSDGSYDIEVPDDANVTPYIDPPATYTKTYLQTFHTSGQDLEAVHFQVPRDWHYDAFSNLLEIPRDKDGKINDCVIVSTFSIHEARDATEFEPGFKDVYPHGLAESTATIEPRPQATKGPFYFGFPVIIPDSSRTESSIDGGVLWTEVPPGYYWMQPEHPTERLAPFLAHCEGGRVVNASPPWGFYELKGSDGPDPAVMAVAPDEAVDAKVARKVLVRHKGRRRTVTLGLTAGEPLSAKLVVRRGKTRLGASKLKSLSSGKRKVVAQIRRSAPKGRSRVTLTLKDKAGNSRTVSRVVRLPRR